MNSVNRIFKQFFFNYSSDKLFLYNFHPPSLQVSKATMFHFSVLDQKKLIEGGHLNLTFKSRKSCMIADL